GDSFPYKVVLHTDSAVITNGPRRPGTCSTEPRLFRDVFFCFESGGRMRCIELVMQEHVILRRGLDILDGMVSKLEGGERIEIADAITILKFFRFFGVEYHQTIEENVVFPSLLRAAPQESRLRHMLSDHGEQPEVVTAIESALSSR